MNTVILTLVLGMGMVESLSVVEIREGDTLTLYCPLYVSNNSIILWSKGDRLLFVGDLKIKQDQRYAVVNDNLMVSDTVLSIHATNWKYSFIFVEEMQPNFAWIWTDLN